MSAENLCDMSFLCESKFWRFCMSPYKSLPKALVMLWKGYWGLTMVSEGLLRFHDCSTMVPYWFYAGSTEFPWGFLWGVCKGSVIVPWGVCDGYWGSMNGLKWFQLSLDNLTLANSPLPDNSHDFPGHNSQSLIKT